MAGCGGMWQVVMVCGMVWAHVAGCGGMWQGVGACGRGRCSGWGSALWHRWVHVAGVGTYGRVWGHVAEVVAGCGVMSQGVGVCGMGSGL